MTTTARRARRRARPRPGCGRARTGSRMHALLGELPCQVCRNADRAHARRRRVLHALVDTFDATFPQYSLTNLRGGAPS